MLLATVGLLRRVSATIGCKTYQCLIVIGSSLSLLPYASDFTPFLRPTAAAKALIVDCNNEVLVDSSNQHQIPLEASDSPLSSYSVNYEEVDPRAVSILSQFPVLTSPFAVVTY